MNLPEYLRNLPMLDVPIPPEKAEVRAMRSDDGLTVFFIAHEDVHIPDHSHKGQWGTVLSGELVLTVEGQTKTYHPGESYDIPSGAVHSATLKAGSIALDIFEEPDRYGFRK